MKKVVLLLMVVMLVVGFVSIVSADVDLKDTSKKWLHSHTYEDETIDKANPLEAGVGVDLTVFKSDTFLSYINIEARKDFVDMERGTLYVVVGIDITPKD